MAYFLCKLAPPRPSFPADMSPAEGALMAEHAAYWARLAEAGAAIVVGPVADPAGFWGLAVIEADDEDHARALLADDPVTRAGSGFTYEICPMPQVLLRDSRPHGRSPASS